jgi:hypothetical protein
VTIVLFVAIKTTNQTLATNLIELFDQYGLRNKIIAYAKDEWSNLITMIYTLKSNVKCEVLGLDESFRGTCFGHVFLKHVNMLQLMKRFVRNL